MAVRTKPRGAPGRWYRRPWTHLVLGLLVAILAVTWTGERARQGVLDNLDARLRDAGAGVDAGLITVEAEQLSALRSIEFTNGVPQALEATNADELNRLVTPLQANSGVPMVDVVEPDGRVVFAVRSKGAPRPVASRAGMPAIAQAMREARGARGAQVRADLTAYTQDGIPIATTNVRAPTRVAPDVARGLVGGGAIVNRFTAGGTREVLGRLIIDHEPAAVLGVALHDNSPATRRAVILYSALGLIATVILIATFWARVHRAQTRT